MTKDSGGLRAWALMAVAVAVVWAMEHPVAAAAVADLVGAGPGLGALLWGCGVCVGAAGMLLMGPATALIAYLSAGANLLRISGCVVACYGAFTV